MRGASGTDYIYERYPVGSQWNDMAANYICAQAGANIYAKYVGQTSSLRDRIPNHEKWPCCNRHGVNEIHVNRDATTEQGRRAQEKDLIAGLAPPHR